ncbi:YqaA family protein [Flavicella marina]|uniref:YqaA family protein n=1 Tax=Flavicella marina TaxID=1475951 RepID=UPI001264209E|nr:VTT domain-containing protein [Flavicella marina]
MQRYLNLYYQYLNRSGLFQFLGRNLLKLGLVLAVFFGAMFLLEKFVITLKEVFALIVDTVDAWMVFVIFVFSESFLGLLPPDFFIVWTKELGDDIGVNPWLLTFLLAGLSYIGGLISYFIGAKLIHIPKIHEWVTRKYAELFKNLKKWGGFFVVISALLPVPFSIVLMICGITSYPFKWVLYLGLFRFVRFGLYAMFLFTLV